MTLTSKIIKDDREKGYRGVGVTSITVRNIGALSI